MEKNEKMEPSIEEESTIVEDYDEKIKIMIIGDSTVGKTSLLRKYIQNEFSSNFINTVGFDIQIKFLNINNKKIKLQISDTAGQERYRIVSKNFFNASEGFIIVYDITKRESFVNVNNWVEQIKEIAPNYSKSIIFGNKCDLKEMRDIDINEGKELANKFNFKFFETSAKEGININEGFEALVKEIMGDIMSVKSRRNDTTILKKKKHKVKKSEPCC